MRPLVLSVRPALHLDDVIVGGFFVRLLDIVDLDVPMVSNESFHFVFMAYPGELYT